MPSAPVLATEAKQEEHRGHAATLRQVLLPPSLGPPPSPGSSLTSGRSPLCAGDLGPLRRQFSDLGPATALVVPRSLPLLRRLLWGWADASLMAAVLVSVLLVTMSTVGSLGVAYREAFETADVCFVLLFVVEFLLRLKLAHNRRAYLTSFFGVIDVLSFLPALVSLVLEVAMPSAVREASMDEQMHIAIMLQLLRTFRVFRILKLARYVQESHDLVLALESPRSMVFIFGFFVVSLLLSAVIYAIEGGPDNPNFESIPACLYWTVVTISTVGYGDAVPQTVCGKAFAVVVIVIGYGAIVSQGIRFVDPELELAGPEPPRPRPEQRGEPRPGGPELEDAEGAAERGGLLESLKCQCALLSPREKAELVGHLALQLSAGARPAPVLGGS